MCGGCGSEHHHEHSHPSEHVSDVLKGRDLLADEIALDPNNLVIKKPISPPLDSSSSCPKRNSKVKVHYTGTLEDGTKFDSSRDRNDPFGFTVFGNQVIKGWDIAVSSLKEGERASFWIHYTLAYGERGSPPNIPAKANLVFDIELLEIEVDYTDMDDESLLKEINIRKEKGGELFKNGELDGAIMNWKKALDAADSLDFEENRASNEQLFVNIKLNLGLAYIKTNQPTEAVQILAEVLASHTTNMKALYRSGLAHFKLLNYEEALGFVSRMLEVDANSKEALSLRRDVLKAKQNEDRRQKDLFKKMMSAL
ncbi:hypothetical protein RCL1_004939 [Eukaryota sp. TZLM3-RCL]